METFDGQRQLRQYRGRARSTPEYFGKEIDAAEIRLDLGIFDGQESMCKIMKLNMVAMSKDGTRTLSGCGMNGTLSKQSSRWTRC